MAPFTRSACKRSSTSHRAALSSHSLPTEMATALTTTGSSSSQPTSTSASASRLPTPAIASDNAERDVFRFMDLPSELRLHIYRMALQREKPLLLHLSRSADADDMHSIGIEGGHSHEPGTARHSRSPEHSRRTEVQASGSIIVDVPSPPPNLPARFHPLWIENERRASTRASAVFAVTTTVKGVNTEPLVPEILRVSKQIYREARPVLYADNEFALLLGSATQTLASLHQRSRSLIKCVYLKIPTHHDVLEGFADVVRLGLRYCWGLKRLTLTLPDSFPEEHNTSYSPTTNVYANAFHILRWLPKTCEVKLMGDKIPAEIRKIIDENARLAETLDDTAYARRQHQMPDSSRYPATN